MEPGPGEIADDDGIIGEPVADGAPRGTVEFRKDGKVDLVTRSGVKVSGISLNGAQIAARDNGVVIVRERPAESGGKQDSSTVVTAVFLGEGGKENKGNFVVVDGASELSVFPAQEPLPMKDAVLNDLTGEIRFSAEDSKKRQINYSVGYNDEVVITNALEGPLAKEMVELRIELVLALVLVELQKQTDIAIEGIEVAFFQLTPEPVQPTHPAKPGI